MKRTISALLCISLFFGLLALPSLSAAPDPRGSYAGFGDYTVHLDADPTTNTPPAEFGTSAANGKVWVDKSVVVEQDHFEVTLSALAQEYISESGTTVNQGPAADVVMILDLSASMQQNNLSLDGESMTRTKAMVKAVNEAVDIILSANEKNRIMIYGYQSDSKGNNAVITEFLPLGHYTNNSWNNANLWDGNSGKYFNYLTSGGIQTARNLKKDGATFSQKSASTSYGTCTQHGILKGVQALATAIGKETKSVDRKPYVLLFTDGAPGNANTTWYDTSTTACIRDGHENDGSAQISALTILSAALMKDQLKTAYQIYNGKETKVEWFNIGLGVVDNSKPAKTAYGTLFLQPANLPSDTTTYGSSIRNNINTYTSGKYSAYASYATNYSYTVDAYIVDQGDELKNAFKSLADKVEEETKTITFPILSAEGATDDLVFTDVLGEGMKASALDLYIKNNPPIRGTLQCETYTFAGKKTTAVLSTDLQGRQVLTWNIPADEVAIYSFANRQDPTDGNYIATAPIRLTYAVSLADSEAYNGAILHSNTEAKAQFTVPADNLYYYAENGLKTAPFAAQPKAENISGTSNYHTAFATETGTDGAAITVTLGNNGTLKPAMQLEKTADTENPAPAATISYTLKIKNVGKNTLYNIIVTDTLPADLLYLEGSAENAPVTVDGKTLQFTVAELDAGETLSIHYKTTVDPASPNYKQLVNTAAVTEVHTIEVANPVEETHTITVRRLYKVAYEWSGNIPADVTLPTDAARYPTGARYTVDGEFTAQTKIETKDAFGNVTERWTFSGWEDPQGGVMGEADVTLRGVWSYESFEIPAHNVIYEWSGTIPAGKIPPADSNDYVYNQPYAVDRHYSAATVIETKDAFGNLNGRYTFSGWTDPNNGVMGNEDVTIRGIWSFEKIDVLPHKVFYVWSGDVPKGQTLPQNSSFYLPHQTYPVDSLYTADTVIETKDRYGNLTGRYTFSGWTDPNEGVMGDADVTIAGVWQYTPIEPNQYNVLYTWSGDIPAGVTLPAKQSGYVTGQAYAVDQAYSSATVIETKDAFGNLNGRYTFSGWTDPNGGIMGTADVIIPGVWEYKKIDVPPHKVIYTWSGDLPEGQAIPVDPNTYVNRQQYPVDTTYTNQTAIDDFDAFGNLCGRWTFSGWTDPNGGVMGNKDVVIPGIWKYEPLQVPAHKVLYVWTGDVPADEKLPTDENQYVQNQPYTIDPTYTDRTVIETRDEFGNLNGRYSFSGWTDPNGGIMGDADITVPGVWKYETITVPDYKVLYTWSGQVPAEQIIPTDENRYVKNQPYAVDETFTADTQIEQFNEDGYLVGRYTFSGWTDPNEGMMGEADVLILGVWSYEEIPLPEPDPDPNEPDLPVDPEDPTEPSEPTPEEPTTPNAGSSPNTGEILPLNVILILWITSAAILILLGLFRKKFKE